ncbi:MAG: hypothetical protein KJ558_10810 [Gammaproteobacteria bacterium]|nr:hypothetical protein [Gammaproteobacteria bacterium]MBU1655298.1 hypothetical protein [Gammaproteobacteria bacterium]MBU1960768.1 hypothetical protein [Gammaproteobacteria bacterium]
MAKQFLKLTTASIALLVAVLQPALAEPSGSACHVTVQGGQSTIILVDTQDLAEAQTVAQGAKARQAGVELPVESLVQCIRFPGGGGFTDPLMQAHFEKMDK